MALNSRSGRIEHGMGILSPRRLDRLQEVLMKNAAANGSIDVTQLVDRARGGDAAALGRIVESYTHYLTLLARLQIGKRLQGKVDPSDVVQDVFLEVHRQLVNFRGNSEGEFLAWLRRILAGQIAVVLRRYFGTKGRDLKLERELVAQLDESSAQMDRGLVAECSTPSQRASRREQALILADKLSSLPDDYREVILLRHIEGLAPPEVAQRMNRTADSVQKLWVRALASLRKAVGED
jgi:RNA polymerase sigma-70 factor, ECF subfamily